MWTTEEILGFSERFRGQARAMFLVDGGLQQVAFVFGTRPDRQLHVVQPDQSMDDSALAKHLLATAIERVARAHGASAIAVAGEAWAMRGVPLSLAGPTRSIAEEPDRVEVLSFSVESHRLGARTWFAPVVRPEGRPPWVGAWHEQKTKVVETNGRFMHLLERAS